MRWPWIREARLIELQTAKEILAEVFHARPGEVEMIKRRMEEIGLGSAIIALLPRKMQK